LLRPPENSRVVAALRRVVAQLSESVLARQALQPFGQVGPMVVQPALFAATVVQPALLAVVRLELLPEQPPALALWLVVVLVRPGALVVGLHLAQPVGLVDMVGLLGQPVARLALRLVGQHLQQAHHWTLQARAR
jgi:hypothetical protein